MNFSGARGTFPIEISIHSDRLSIQIYGQKTDLKVLNIFSIKTYQIFPAGSRFSRFWQSSAPAGIYLYFFPHAPVNYIVTSGAIIRSTIFYTHTRRLKQRNRWFQQFSTTLTVFRSSWNKPIFFPSPSANHIMISRAIIRDTIFLYP